MKALLLSEYSHLEVVELPRPTPNAGEVLIRVAACGICGSDVHGYDGASGRRIPPIVMGHEAAGTITAVGAAVDAFRVGDRVTFDSTVYCGRCDFCRRGEINLCDHREVLGVSCAEYRRFGAFAEYLVVPAHILYRLPDDFSFAQAAMLEAVSVALHGVAVSPVPPGATVLVIGAGMIGLLLLQAARVAGAARVFVSDVDPTRLRLAARLGATETLCLSGDDLTASIQHLTASAGVDVVLEAVGRPETVATAVGCVRKGGTVTLVGNISPTVSIPLQTIVSRQIRLQGSCASAGEYPEAIQLIAAAAIQVDPLITAVSPLAEGPAWFARLHAREPNLMKVVLDPQTDPETDAHPDAHPGTQTDPLRSTQPATEQAR